MVVLVGCHAPARLGVPTTVVAIKGACDTSSVVEVGAALPLSGPLAAPGRAELDGLELAVDGVNRSGGVMGSHSCLELMYKDDRSDAAVDDQALLDLVNEEHVSMVVGPFVALDDAADRAHLGALGVTAMSFSAFPETFDPNSYPYTFPVASSISAQAGALAQYVGRQRWRRVTVVSSGSALSSKALNVFTAATRHDHVDMKVTPGPVDSLRTASAALRTVMSSATDALVVFDDGSTLGPVLEVRHAVDPTLPTVAITTSGLPQLPAHDVRGVEVVVPSALSVGRSVHSALTSFRKRLLSSFHMSKLSGALTPYAQAYDSVEMFAGAVNGVDADDPGSLRTFLESTNYQGLLGSYDYTSSAHEGISGSQEAVVPLTSLVDGIFVDDPAAT